MDTALRGTVPRGMEGSYIEKGEKMLNIYIIVIF